MVVVIGTVFVSTDGHVSKCILEKPGTTIECLLSVEVIVDGARVCVIVV